MPDTVSYKVRIAVECIENEFTDAAKYFDIELNFGPTAEFTSAEKAVAKAEAMHAAFKE